ncbi:MAG: EthD family reductase [Ktedonobacterales bacterium]
MAKISFLYPNQQGARFDMDYYLHTHMPQSIERLSAAKGFQGVSVDRGLGGEAPGIDPTYIVMCHFLFDSMEDFLAAFNVHAEFLQGDMANYTDIKPIIQVSTVEISK